MTPLAWGALGGGLGQLGLLTVGLGLMSRSNTSREQQTQPLALATAQRPAETLEAFRLQATANREQHLETLEALRQQGDALRTLIERTAPSRASRPALGGRGQGRKGKNTMQTLKSTYTGLVMLGLLGLLGQQAGAQTPDRGVIESPSAVVSGIGFISGWKCNATDIELWLTGAERAGVLTLAPAQNLPRADTAGVCLGEEDNGWLIQVNWNELIGYDRVVARDNGAVFDSANFTIGQTGLPFINDKEGTEIEVVDFPSPDTATRLIWSTATQHFEVSGTEDSREGSGAGAVICEPAFNREEQTHGRTITCEYREILQSLPRAVDIVLDDDGCLKKNVRFEAHSYHHFHAGTVDGRPDRDANWYLVRRWDIYYTLGVRWSVTDLGVFAVPVPDDEPGYWNQHKYYSKRIPFDDQASYHFRQTPDPDRYAQYQFYALGPVVSGGWDGRRPCFREIPSVPAP